MTILLKNNMQKIYKNSWKGNCNLNFFNANSVNGSGVKTIFKSKFSSPYKLLKSENDKEGRCILPMLHTAGGLVGGDELELDLFLNNDTKVLLTTTSAQKVYGSAGISKINPNGIFSSQKIDVNINKNSHLEYLPQETIVFANGLFSQQISVKLSKTSSFLYFDLIRIGRTSLGESIEKGIFRSKLQIQRENESFDDWEFIDQIELNNNIFNSQSGMDGNPVFGSLIWISEQNFPKEKIDKIHSLIKNLVCNDTNQISIGYLENGLSIRFLGQSTQDVRNHFFSIWKQIRRVSGFIEPKYNGVWPLQDSMNY